MFQGPVGDPYTGGNAFFDSRPNPPGWVCICDFAGSALDLPFQTLVAPQPGRVLMSLSAATLWVGLRNSDDVGTAFDLRVKLYKNDELVASGLTRCVKGVARNPAGATAVVVPFGPFDPVSLTPDDVLALRVSTRIGTNADETRCSGPGASHSSATGLRLYYDSTARRSRFEAEITPDPSDEVFLRSDGTVCKSGPGAGVTNRSLHAQAPAGRQPQVQGLEPPQLRQRQSVESHRHLEHVGAIGIQRWHRACRSRGAATRSVTDHG